MRIGGAVRIDLLQAEAIDHAGQVLVPERGHAHVAPEIFTGPHRVFDAELGLEIAPDVHPLDRRAYPAGAELDDAEPPARDALEPAAHHHPPADRKRVV